MGEIVDGDDYTYPRVVVTGAQAEIAALRQQLATAENDLRRAWDIDIAERNQTVDLLRQQLAQAQAEIERSGRLILDQRAELADVYHRAEQAEAALAKLTTPCAWRHIVGGGWLSGCGRKTSWGGQYCQFCGHLRGEGEGEV